MSEPSGFSHLDQERQRCPSSRFVDIIDRGGTSEQHHQIALNRSARDVQIF